MKSILDDERKKSTITNLYRYSDLSVQAIAQQVDLGEKIVQQLVDNLVKNDAMEVIIEQGMTNVEKIMSPIVVSADCSKTSRDAALLMADNKIGSVVVTKNGKPLGIVTQSDVVRWASVSPSLLDSALEELASVPLITTGRGTSVEEAARIMITNQIHKLPVVDGHTLLGIVTVTDLAVFLSPSRRSGLALSVLQAISRGKQRLH